MVKKNFQSGIDALFGESSSLKNENKDQSSNVNTKEKKVRTTIIAKMQHLDELKAIAYWERKTLTDVITEAMDAYITQYIIEKGEIKVVRKTNN